MSKNQVITSIDIEDTVGQTLFQYLSQQISCRPYSEYRHNIKLSPLFTSVKTRSAQIHSYKLDLPTTGGWYLYRLDATSITEVKFPLSKEWVCLADHTLGTKVITGFCSRHNIDIRVILGSAKLHIPRRHVFITKHPNDNSFIIAINSDVITTFNHSKDIQDVWLNIYYHHTSKFDIKDYTTYTQKERNEFLEDYQNSTKNQMTFLNGEVVLGELSLNDMKSKDYAEIITDNDIVNSIDIEVTNENIYKTEKNKKFLLVHIPKELNPKNYIISSRVCDVVVFHYGAKTGRLINRANTDLYFQTLTHNDFGIDVNLLSAYYSDNHNKYVIRVYIRNHKKDGLLLERDCNLTACLYRYSDSIIKNILLNNKVPCWSAGYLHDHSSYQVLEDRTYETITPKQALEIGVTGLGYKLAADVSCKRVYHVLAAQTVTISLAPCFINKNVKAHVYFNGEMIEPDHVRCAKDHQYLSITVIDRKIDTSKSKYFTIELFEDIPYRAGKYVLKPGESVEFYVDQDYLMFYDLPFTDLNKVRDYYIYNRFDLKTSYYQIKKSEYNEFVKEETVESLRKVILTNKKDTTKTFYVVSENAYAKIYGVELQLKEMNYDIFCSHLLTVKAIPWMKTNEKENNDETITVPYLNQNNQILVYLNHRELTKDLDYRVYQIKTKAGHLCGQFVISQNVDYLNVAGNIFEIFSISEHLLSEVTGFITEGRATFESYSALYPHTSVLFTDGLAYDKNPSNAIGVYGTDLHGCTRAGASTKIRSFIPFSMYQLFSKYVDSDNGNFKDVVDFIDKTNFNLESPAIIEERSHHIYSTFLQTITELILRKQLRYNPKYSDKEIKNSLKPYESMLLFDIGLSDNNIEITDPSKFIQPPKSGLDYRFVDVLPTYRIESNIPDLVVKDKLPLLVIKSVENSINGNYICINPDPTFVRPGERYKHMQTNDGRFNDQTARIWKCENGSYIEHVYMEHNSEDICPQYWVIFDKNGTPILKARDGVGVESIWNLKWIRVSDDASDPSVKVAATIEPVAIEINTAGEFLARRIYYIDNLEDRNYLNRIAKLYLNEDLVIDGVNLS